MEVGSVMHKMGVRWTEYMESESIIGPHDVYYMVLCILPISKITLMAFMVSIMITLVHKGFESENVKKRTFKSAQKSKCTQKCI